LDQTSQPRSGVLNLRSLDFEPEASSAPPRDAGSVVKEAGTEKDRVVSASSESNGDVGVLSQPEEVGVRLICAEVLMWCKVARTV